MRSIAEAMGGGCDGDDGVAGDAAPEAESSGA
jgi:hypothetical protein